MNESGSGASGRGALAELKEAVSSLFEQVVGLAPDLGLGREFPRHELRVEDDGFRVLVESPGIGREDVDVSVSGRTLTISSRRERFEPPAGARMLRSERPSGKYELTLQLPADVDPLAIVARMQEGVLEVRLPKPSARGRSVRVEDAEAGAAQPAVEQRPATGATPAAEEEPPAEEGPAQQMPWEEGPETPTAEGEGGGTQNG